MHETLCALASSHIGGGDVIRHAGGVFVAEKFDVAPQRHGRNFPSRAVAVVEAEQFRAEANREGQYFDPTQAGDKEMAKLMEKYNHRQNEQKRNDIAQN